MVTLSSVAVKPGPDPLSTFAWLQQSVRRDQPLRRDADNPHAFNELLAPDARPKLPSGDCGAGHAAALSQLKLIQPSLEARLLDALAEPPFGVRTASPFLGRSLPISQSPDRPDASFARALSKACCLRLS